MGTYLWDVLRHALLLFLAVPGHGGAGTSTVPLPDGQRLLPLLQGLLKQLHAWQCNQIQAVRVPGHSGTKRYSMHLGLLRQSSKEGSLPPTERINVFYFFPF